MSEDEVSQGEEPLWLTEDEEEQGEEDKGPGRDMEVDEDDEDEDEDEDEDDEEYEGEEEDDDSDEEEQQYDSDENIHEMEEEQRFSSEQGGTTIHHDGAKTPGVNPISMSDRIDLDADTQIAHQTEAKQKPAITPDDFGANETQSHGVSTKLSTYRTRANHSLEHVSLEQLEAQFIEVYDERNEFDEEEILFNKFLESLIDTFGDEDDDSSNFGIDIDDTTRDGGKNAASLAHNTTITSTRDVNSRQTFQSLVAEEGGITESTPNPAGPLSNFYTDEISDDDEDENDADFLVNEEDLLKDEAEMQRDMLLVKQIFSNNKENNRVGVNYKKRKKPRLNLNNNNGTTRDSADFENDILNPRFQTKYFRQFYELYGMAPYDSRIICVSQSEMKEFRVRLWQQIYMLTQLSMQLFIQTSYSDRKDARGLANFTRARLTILSNMALKVQKSSHDSVDCCLLPKIEITESDFEQCKLRMESNNSEKPAEITVDYWKKSYRDVQLACESFDQVVVSMVGIDCSELKGYYETSCRQKFPKETYSEKVYGTYSSIWDNRLSGSLSSNFLEMIQFQPVTSNVAQNGSLKEPFQTLRLEEILQMNKSKRGEVIFSLIAALIPPAHRYSPGNLIFTKHEDALLRIAKSRFPNPRDTTKLHEEFFPTKTKQQIINRCKNMNRSKDRKLKERNNDSVFSRIPTSNTGNGTHQSQLVASKDTSHQRALEVINDHEDCSDTESEDESDFDYDEDEYDDEFDDEYDDDQLGNIMFREIYSEHESDDDDHIDEALLDDDCTWSFEDDKKILLAVRENGTSNEAFENLASELSLTSPDIQKHISAFDVEQRYKWLLKQMLTAEVLR